MFDIETPGDPCLPATRAQLSARLGTSALFLYKTGNPNKQEKGVSCKQRAVCPASGQSGAPTQPIYVHDLFTFLSTWMRKHLCSCEAFSIPCQHHCCEKIVLLCIHNLCCSLPSCRQIPRAVGAAFSAAALSFLPRS